VSDEITFREALQKLGIPEYEERIFNSNSHGELFHLLQYFDMARMYDGSTWFKPLFESIVKYAEENWERPDSVFQHIAEIMDGLHKEIKEEAKQ